MTTTHIEIDQSEVLSLEKKGGMIDALRITYTFTSYRLNLSHFLLDHTKCQLSEESSTVSLSSVNFHKFNTSRKLRQQKWNSFSYFIWLLQFFFVSHFKRSREAENYLLQIGGKKLFVHIFLFFFLVVSGCLLLIRRKR